TVFAAEYAYVSGRRAWSRRRGVAVLLLVAAAVPWLGGTALRQVTVPTEERAGPKDTDVFRAVVSRVHSGAGYYEAQQAVCELSHYPGNSVLNYRTPTYAWVLAALPDETVGAVLLGLLAIACLAGTYSRWRRDRGPGSAMIAVLLMAGTFAWVV